VLVFSAYAPYSTTAIDSEELVLVAQLIFQASDTHLTSSDIRSVDQHGEATTNIDG
jgi:hypothetical protein